MALLFTKTADRLVSLNMWEIIDEACIRATFVPSVKMNLKGFQALALLIFFVPKHKLYFCMISLSRKVGQKKC